MSEYAGVNYGDLETEISGILNRYGAEQESNTPDFVLANYLRACLAAFNEATRERDRWYGVNLYPGYKHVDA